MAARWDFTGKVVLVTGVARVVETGKEAAGLNGAAGEEAVADDEAPGEGEEGGGAPDGEGGAGGGPA